MINEYCIIYEISDYVTIMSASEPYDSFKRNEEIHSIVVPAYTMNQAIEYATEVLKISDIKECFELDSEAI